MYRAYLETVVIASKPGGDVTTTCSQVQLEFSLTHQYMNFKDALVPYVKGRNFEIFRTLVQMF